MINFKPWKFLIALLPFLEIAGFVIAGKYLGVVATLFLILATSILGIFILRVQGFAKLAEMQRSMAAGERQEVNVLDSTLLMFAGLLLLLPGFITDFFGLLLLIPQVRKLTLLWLLKHATIQTTTKTRYEHKTSGRVIDVEFHREKEKE